MSTANPRLVRQVREAIADIVENEVSDPRLHLVTIRDVRLSPDAEHATVWYTLVDPGLVSGSGSTGRGVGRGDRLPDAAEAAEGFAAAGPRIQSLLGRRLKTRRTPELTFELDPVAEQAARVEELIRRVRADERDS